MKQYPVQFTNRPPRDGAELSIHFPLPEKALVQVVQDVFGEAEPLCQILIYPAAAPDDETPLAIRFHDDGTIAEICLPKRYRQLLVNAEAPAPSPWLLRRDGC